MNLIVDIITPLLLILIILLLVYAIYYIKICMVDNKVKKNDGNNIIKNKVKELLGKQSEYLKNKNTKI